jgi:hypothetical protein
MNSPFPGMDPYLERFWGDIHTTFLVYARDQINEQLPSDLQARVEETVFLDAGDATARCVYPDVQVVEEPAVAFAPPATATAAQPRIVAVPSEQPIARHIEIVEYHGGGRVVTAIEMLSPANKIPEIGRQRYLDKQHDYVLGGANLVEIDLLRSGRRLVAFPAEDIPEDCRTPYLICVRRANKPLQVEFYPVTLRERLPNIRIPLRPPDADILLQLQPLIDQCYRNGRYNKINYQEPPRPALSEDDERWADVLLREKGLRGS